MDISTCIFCRLDRKVLAESSLSVSFFDGFPVSEGHSLIVPRRHVASIWDMTSDEYHDAFELVRTVQGILSKRFSPQGFNVGVNNGAAGGQSVWHAHIHIIPRYRGDVPDPRGGIRNVIPGKGNY
jgi:ATP adenylyltransferase